MRFPTMCYARPAYAQSDQSLFWSLEYSMTVKLLTEEHERRLHRLVNAYTCRIPNCWKSHVAPQLYNWYQNLQSGLVDLTMLIIGRRRDKSCLRGFQLCGIQTDLLSYRNWLEN